MSVNQHRALNTAMTGARDQWHVCGRYQDDLFIRCMLGMRFRGRPTPKYDIMHMKLPGAIAVVFLVNHDFSSYVNQSYKHCAGIPSLLSFRKRLRLRADSTRNLQKIRDDCLTASKLEQKLISRPGIYSHSKANYFLSNFEWKCTVELNAQRKTPGALGMRQC